MIKKNYIVFVFYASTKAGFGFFTKQMLF